MTLRGNSRADDDLGPSCSHKTQIPVVPISKAVS